MKEYSTIIWDFNGTIIDDVMPSLKAVNDMLIKRNQTPIDLDVYYSAVDVPIWKFYEKVFLSGTITPEEAIEEYDKGYEKYLPEKPLMNGIVEVLSCFKEKGKRQIIVSASHIDKVNSRLEDLSIREYFSTVLAHSDYNAKDKTYLAKAYLMENNISPDNVVVIGDCVFDFQMADALGCDCILNTKGHQSRREFSLVSAKVIDELSELKSYIE